MQLPTLAKENGCKNIGIYGRGTTTEYHIWAVLEAPFNQYRLEWIVAGSPSSSLGDPYFDPCLIICFECPPEQTTIRTFVRVFQGNRYNLFEPMNNKTE